MKSRIILLSIIFIIGLSTNSCEWIFGPGHTNTIEKDLILDYDFGDMFIYTAEDAMADTFKVTSFTHAYDELEDVDRISVALNYRYISNKAFIILVVPKAAVILPNDYYLIQINAVQPGVPDSVKTQTPQTDLEINGTYYNDVYIYENDTASGNSDTLITKLYYQGNIGILGYTYENGDEYLLDEIIKVED